MVLKTHRPVNKVMISKILLISIFSKKRMIIKIQYYYPYMEDSDY